MKSKKLDFIELSNNYGGYYDFYRGKIVKMVSTFPDDTIKKIYGTCYKMNKKLTDVQKTELLHYKNVQLFYSKCEYAPELVSNVVFLAD